MCTNIYPTSSGVNFGIGQHLHQQNQKHYIFNTKNGPEIRLKQGSSLCRREMPVSKKYKSARMSPSIENILLAISTFKKINCAQIHASRRTPQVAPCDQQTSLLTEHRYRPERYGRRCFSVTMMPIPGIRLVSYSYRPQAAIDANKFDQVQFIMYA